MAEESPLKLSVKRHLSSKQLSTEQLQALNRLQQTGADDRPPLPESAEPSQDSPRRRFHWLLAAAAACLLLGIALLHPLLSPGPTKTPLSVQIAQEVAKNHIKMKPLEVSTTDLQRVRDYFSELDFAPISSDIFRPKAGQLQGARYCSIQGVTAAQLRYTQSDGMLQSLYEVGYDPELFGEIPRVDQGEEPLVIYAKGVKVSLWVEKDLLVVSAENSK